MYHTVLKKKNIDADTMKAVWKKISLDAFLVFLGGVIIGGIVLVKSRTTAEFLSDPLILFYTFFVTIFQLSRIISALLYRSAYRSATKANNPGNEPFEPSVSFVIPCMNEEAAIKHTIEKCFAVEYPKELVEVIVINDGSTDRTLDRIMDMKAAYPQLVVVNWKENRGKRDGMAEGFRRASGDIVIQLDSDSFIEPSTFRHFVKPFKNPLIGGVSAHTDPANPDENILTKMQTAYYFMSFRILKAAESTFYTVFCCSGCASAYRRSAVMPFLEEWTNETFLGRPITWGDDRSMTNWIIKHGYQTLYTDKVRAYTIVPNTLKQFIKQQIRWKKGWFVNSLFASKFIIKREPFVAFTYFFPLMLVTLLTPFMAARAFLYTPVAYGPSSTFFYVIGVLLIASLIMTVYRFMSPDNAYWPYLFVWATINMLVLSYLLIFALATIQNRSWGTRAPAHRTSP